MAQFKLALKQKVRIIVSGEVGDIVGRAQYVEDPSAYYVEYKAADGRNAKDWFSARELEEVT